MQKRFKVPVVVTKDDFFSDPTYKVEGVGSFWDVETDEYDDEDEALEAIVPLLQKAVQKELDQWGSVSFEDYRDIDIDKNQKITFVFVEADLPKNYQDDDLDFEDYEDFEDEESDEESEEDDLDSDSDDFEDDDDFDDEELDDFDEDDDDDDDDEDDDDDDEDW